MISESVLNKMAAFALGASFSSLTLILATYFSQVQSGSNDLAKSTRVISGRLARQNEVPYIVSIQRDKGTGKGNEHWCGGSIFNERFIITAAHCLYGETTLSIVAGTLEPAIPGTNTQAIKAKRIIVHEKYSLDGPLNDIGLLELEKGLKYNSAVQPISIPPTGTVASGAAVLSGWGGTQAAQVGDLTGSASKKLMTVDLKIVPKDECDKQYKTVAKKDVYAPQRKLRPDEAPIGMEPPSSGHLCAGAEGKDACRYDSGGPLQCTRKVDGKPVKYLCGVVSYGHGCANILPGAYADVSKFHGWIVKNTAN